MALVILMLGFGHKPAPSLLANAPLPIEAAFMLPDGTMPDLCLPGQEGQDRQDHARQADDCLACRIGSQFLLPEPTADPVPVRLAVNAGLHWQMPVAPTLASPRSPAQPRAPPLALIDA